MGEMVEMAPKPRPVGRRTSVSAESMDPNKMKAQMANVTVIEKEPEVYENLMKVVGRSPLPTYARCRAEGQDCEGIQRPLMKNGGEDVITQGDIGDTFYLLESGEVDVYKKKPDAEEIKVHTYKSGDAFGELALVQRSTCCHMPCCCGKRGQTMGLRPCFFQGDRGSCCDDQARDLPGLFETVPILSTLNRASSRHSRTPSWRRNMPTEHPFAPKVKKATTFTLSKRDLRYVQLWMHRVRARTSPLWIKEGISGRLLSCTRSPARPQ